MWWLLHRGSTLEKIARYYEYETWGYCRDRGIALDKGLSWENIVEYSVLTTGLLHDIAYPLEYHLRKRTALIESSGDELQILVPKNDIFTSPSLREHFLRELEGTWIEGCGLDLEMRLRQLERAQFKHGHALLGALNILRRESNAKSLNTLSGLVIQLAARAIVTHHDEGDDEITSDPLAALLFVADNLQAWRRPFLCPQRSSKESGARRIVVVEECLQLEFEAQGAGYSVQFCMTEEEAHWEALRSNYSWKFKHFREPNQRFEGFIGSYNRAAAGLGVEGLPLFSVTEERCISPGAFLRFMER